jgi:hypothetical protein
VQKVKKMVYLFLVLVFFNRKHFFFKKHFIKKTQFMPENPPPPGPRISGSSGSGDPIIISAPLSIKEFESYLYGNLDRRPSLFKVNPTYTPKKISTPKSPTAKTRSHNTLKIDLNMLHESILPGKPIPCLTNVEVEKVTDIKIEKSGSKTDIKLVYSHITHRISDTDKHSLCLLSPDNPQVVNIIFDTGELKAGNMYLLKFIWDFTGTFMYANTDSSITQQANTMAHKQIPPQAPITRQTPDVPDVKGEYHHDNSYIVMVGPYSQTQIYKRYIKPLLSSNELETLSPKKNSL